MDVPQHLVHLVIGLALGVIGASGVWALAYLEMRKRADILQGLLEYKHETLPTPSAEELERMIGER